MRSLAEHSLIRSQLLLCALLCLFMLAGCSSLFKAKPAASYTEPVTGMEFVLVPGGCFQMGDLWEQGNDDEKPVHQVCLDDFYLAKTEVTQGQWALLMGSNPSHFQTSDQHPVEKVSWNDAVGFLGKLSAAGDHRFRLPTEAEWEYACRSGGKQEQICGSGPVSDHAWFDRTGGGSTQPVGTRKANGLGLYDMSGNVWELCADIYAKDYYSVSPEKNPQGAAEGAHFVKRGGSWSISPRYLRSTGRGRVAPDDAHYSTGFRVAFPVQGK